MHKSLYFLTVLIFTSMVSLGNDGYQRDTIHSSEKDTLILKQDTTITPQTDTLATDTVVNDTIYTQEADTVGHSVDTTTIPSDTLQQTADTVFYPSDTITVVQDSLVEVQDTLVLDSKLDSAVYFLENEALDETRWLLDDTLKRHIGKLLYYIKSQPVDSSISYLENYLQTTRVKKDAGDTSEVYLSDTLLNYLNYLVDTARVDSIQFHVITGKNDSVSLWLHREGPADSSRMILYDDLDHPAGLWLKPMGKKALKVKLDEYTVIEQTGFRERKEEDLPMILDMDQLQDYKGVEMVFGQWKMDGRANLNFNQGYVKNWIKGGESSLSTLFDISYSADYKKGKTVWDNDVEYKFGILQSGNKGLRKNEDILEINSKFGSNAKKKWYYSALVNFTTQFFRGYDYPNDSVPVSGILSPAYFVFSIGMDYKPNDNFTLLLSPISSKITMMADTSKFDQTKYGISKNQKTRKEIGAYIKTIYNLKINEDMHLQNKANLFFNYLDKPQNVDIDWEVTFNMKVTDYINTTITTHLIYDHDIDFPVYEVVDGEEIQVGTTKKLQFKEVLSVGLTYMF